MRLEKIRVGRDYQAVCPEFIPPTDRKGELNERALLVWAPTKDIADDRRKCNLFVPINGPNDS